MVVEGNILFLDLKVRDYMVHIAADRYFLLTRGANRKLTPRGGQN